MLERSYFPTFQPSNFPTLESSNMGFSGEVTLTFLHPQHPAQELQQWRFDCPSVIRIGRASDNDVVLQDSRVSRHHLELRYIETGSPSSPNQPQSAGWQLINQGSNGTFINGKLVSQGWVADGFLIQLAKGGPTLKFQIQLAHSTVHSTWSQSQPSCTHEGNSANNLFCIHCGQPLKVERTIRQYLVLRVLGKGGMGTTYLAWTAKDPNEVTEERENGKNVSAATLHPGTLLVLKEMNADMAEVAKARELFEREARTLKLLHHPGIPKFFDFFVESGKKYLAMELVHGQDLDRRVINFGPVTSKQALSWMIETCEVLDYIHSQDPPRIHRDIKPANLMVRTQDNHIVVLDFGAVKEIGTSPSLVTRIGAEGYSAPEQERGQPVIQSDLYAIGPTLIFLLTGENPQKFYQQVGRTYKFDVKKVPTIAPQLAAVIEKTTQQRIGDRYQTAKELAIALANCL